MDKDTPFILTSHGNIDVALLNGPTTSVVIPKHHHHEPTLSRPGLSRPKRPQLLVDSPIPETGFIKATNKGEGYESIGWRFSPEKTFNHNSLFNFLSGLTAERMKAVFITDQGVFGYNLTPDALTEVALDECLESRIEIIGKDLPTNIEIELMACMAK